MVPPLVLIFFLSFLLNLFWEHVHARLYVHYKGKAITRGILLRAAFFDASFTTLLALPVIFWGEAQFIPLAVFGAFLFAVGLEKFALRTRRWEYRPHMPVIPLLSVGLTPSVQLPFLVLCVFALVL